MGQGTSAAPVDTAVAAPAQAPGNQTSSNGSGLTNNQVKAIAMLMGNLGKSGQGFQGISSQGQRATPQASTIQGGTYFNPNQQR
jgi:hypothetical protein